MADQPQVIPIDGAAKLILEKDDASRRVVTVPEWGVDIELRSISVSQRTSLLTKFQIDSLEKFGRSTEALIWTFTRGAFDVETGKPLFDPNNKHIAQLLTQKRPDVLDRLVKEILELSGMVRGAESTAAKNSEGLTNAD